MHTSLLLIAATAAAVPLAAGSTPGPEAGGCPASVSCGGNCRPTTLSRRDDDIVREQCGNSSVSFAYGNGTTFVTPCRVQFGAPIVEPSSASVCEADSDGLVRCVGEGECVLRLRVDSIFARECRCSTPAPTPAPRQELEECRTLTPCAPGCTERVLTRREEVNAPAVPCPGSGVVFPFSTAPMALSECRQTVGGPAVQPSSASVCRADGNGQVHCLGAGGCALRFAVDFAYDRVCECSSA